ncbi:STAS domain-containing protein [Methylobacter svalbardensis]|uniref:STAS domain-containing protein n=1 Tax=Methylobacter svalbardensis TaxID=3080016 RepID=UPI0030EB7006
MAISEENNLIGYDPLAWMEGNADKNDDTSNNEFCDSNSQSEEQQLIDDSDNSTVSPEEIAISNGTQEDELVIDEIESENNSVLVEEMADDYMDASSVAMQGAVADEFVSAGMDEGICDLDATLTIQHVVKLHEKLKNLLAMHDEIEINASDVSSIDTATLQLLVSLKKDAVKLQKRVTIIYPSPRFVESAQLLGLLDVLDVHDT